MSAFCGCFGSRSPPTPLNTKIDTDCGCALAHTDEASPNQRALGFPLLKEGRRPNFAFVTHDNGETYIATFRAMFRGKVLGYDSNPIPKDVYNDFRIKKKKKSGDTYCVFLDTGGHNLYQYHDKIPQEVRERLIPENERVDLTNVL